jgi:hypothetical protein
MSEYYDNSAFLSQLGNNVQKSTSTSTIIMIVGIGVGIAAIFLAYSIYLNKETNIIAKKVNDEGQKASQDPV